jgi:hypothetical protein
MNMNCATISRLWGLKPTQKLETALQECLNKMHRMCYREVKDEGAQVKLGIQAETKTPTLCCCSLLLTHSTLYWNLSNIDILTPENPIGEGYVTFISDCGG